MSAFIAPREKLYGNLDRIQQLRDKSRTSAPVNVEIDLSNRCSLGCSWCHFAYTHTRGPLAGAPKPDGAVSGGDLMDTTLAKRIVLQLFDAGVRSITWTGGGEPTLHPDFDDIIAFTGGLDICQGIYTHGGHINAERAALLKRTMTFVYVSLDAADAISYKKAKGVNRFDAAAEGIKLLAAAAGDATIGVGYLITPENYEDVSIAARLVEAWGADYLQVRPTIQYEQSHPDTPAENTKWLDAAINAINKARYYQPNIDADIDRFRMYQNWSGHGYTTCWWSQLQTCITPNGKVWTCVNRREHADSEIGDLSVESFADVWARHSARQVDGGCRVMCRGHIANIATDEMVASRPHEAFV